MQIWDNLEAPDNCALVHTWLRARVRTRNFLFEHVGNAGKCNWTGKFVEDGWIGGGRGKGEGKGGGVEGAAKRSFSA